MMTLEEIYQKLSADFYGRTGRTAGGNSELAARFYAVAAQIYGLYVQAEWTRRQCFPQMATGEDLDRHAWLRGIDRRPAAKAEGTVRFYLDRERESDVAVPEGTVCMTAGGVRFLTTAGGTVSAGTLYADVPAEAAEPGAAGNAGADTVIYMALPPDGVAACTNPAPFAGGRDTEDDGSLRTRVLETYRRLANGANNAFYRQEAMSFDGVAAVTVLPRNRGIGTVDLVVAARSGMPDGALLETLREHFEKVREIAVDVGVLEPTKKTVDVTAAITVEDGREYGEVSAAVESAVRGWFTGERLGSPLTRAEFIALIFGVDGVANCALTGPAEDLAAEKSTLPVLGTLTITEG